MGKRIHMRIFFPVMILLILFPVMTWFLFSTASDWYIRYIMKKDVDWLMEQILLESEEIYGNISPEGEVGRKEERQYSKKLLEQIKEIMRKEDMEAQLLILNSKENVIYPSKDTENDSRRAVYEACRAILAENAFSSGSTFCASVGENDYMLNIFEVDSDSNIRAKYFVGYAMIPETKILLSYTGTLILGITVCLLIIMAAVLWMTAKSIARPLKALCRQANLVGRGSYSPIEGHYPIYEVEELKESFNQMAARLKNAEEQNSRFFQNVSHDLRTPLVSIGGYAQGIQCGVFEEPGKAAEIILSESLRLTNLVESILTISKLDSHEFILHPVKLQLEELLEEQVEVLKGMAGEKELVLCVREESVADSDSGSALGSFPFSVMADSSLLIRVLQNIISNCLRYAGSRVEICLESENGWGVVLISDDGEGIPEEELPHVFERFYKGEKGSFGVGLSIVKSGVEYMGGTVKVENKKAPTHGAVYQIKLPLADVN